MTLLLAVLLFVLGAAFWASVTWTYRTFRRDLIIRRALYGTPAERKDARQ